MGFWDSIKSFLSSVFNGIGNFVAGALQTAKDVFKWIYDKVTSAISWIWKAVTGFIKFIYNAICDLFRLIKEAIKGLIMITKKVGRFIYDAVSGAISFAKYVCT